MPMIIWRSSAPCATLNSHLFQTEQITSWEVVEKRWTLVHLKKSPKKQGLQRSFKRILGVFIFKPRLTLLKWMKALESHSDTLLRSRVLNAVERLLDPRPPRRCIQRTAVKWLDAFVDIWDSTFVTAVHWWGVMCSQCSQSAEAVWCSCFPSKIYRSRPAGSGSSGEAQRAELIRVAGSFCSGLIRLMVANV